MVRTGRESIVRRTPELARAEEWALVLEAEGLGPRLLRSASGGWAVSVPSRHLEQAVTELWAYESENRAPEPEERPWPGRSPFYTGLGASAGLLAFYFAHAWTQESVRWVEHGGASAEWILRGELWRTVTALTLHADPAHAGANAAALAFLLTGVCRWLGPGLGAALALGVGALGNLGNAWFHAYDHVSIGASTAVFGALGLLGGAGVVRRRRLGLRGRQAWIPLAAGLAVLAMVGTGGPRVDIWAHLWGFGAGGAAGVLLERSPDRPGTPRAQLRLGAAAAAAVALCWALALR